MNFLNFYNHEKNFRYSSFEFSLNEAFKRGHKTLVETGVDVGPAIYLARVFDTEIDTVVKWFILILIFVFDPLAVSLVIAANVAFEQAAGVIRKPTASKKSKRWWEMFEEKKPKEEPKVQVEEELDEIFSEPKPLKGGVHISQLQQNK